MNESTISNRLITALRKIPHTFVLKTHGHGMQQPGIPDFFICHRQGPRSFAVWVETKGAETKISAIQRSVIAQMRDAGVSVYVLRFVTDRIFAFEEGAPSMTAFSFLNWPEGAKKFCELLLTWEDRNGP